MEEEKKNLNVTDNQEKFRKYRNWHEDSVTVFSGEYHITGEGILSKHDYSIVFEDASRKINLPVEITDQINIYDDVGLSPNTFKVLSSNKIRLAVMDKYGNLTGYFTPVQYDKSGKSLIDQVLLYMDSIRRLAMAKDMEKSGFYNMLSNYKYYLKQGIDLYGEKEALLSSIKELEKVDSINKLMLIEARARENYYHAFNKMIKGTDFCFCRRSKQPPMDPINALISFGNVMLYNEFSRIIAKSTLDDRIGVIHSVNDRSVTLSLDFADIFKPVIVDRVVFSLINNSRINAQTDFCESNGGIYLSKHGKEVFVEAFQEKVKTSVKKNDAEYTYRQLFEREVYNYRRDIQGEAKYHPYRYY